MNGRTVARFFISSLKLYISCQVAEEDESLNIGLTNGRSCWTFRGTHDAIAKLKPKGVESVNQFVRSVCAALASQDTEAEQYKYVLKKARKSQVNVDMVLTINVRIEQGLWWNADVPLRKVKENKVVQHMLDHLIDRVSVLDAQQEVLSAAKKKAVANLHDSFSQFELVQRDKERLEQELYSKFVVVLNEKKRKVSDLKAQLSKVEAQVERLQARRGTAVSNSVEIDDDDDDNNNDDDDGIQGQQGEEEVMIVSKPYSSVPKTAIGAGKRRKKSSFSASATPRTQPSGSVSQLSFMSPIDDEMNNNSDDDNDNDDDDDSDRVRLEVELTQQQEDEQAAIVASIAAELDDLRSPTVASQQLMPPPTLEDNNRYGLASQRHKPAELSGLAMLASSSDESEEVVPVSSFETRARPPSTLDEPRAAALAAKTRSPPPTAAATTRSMSSPAEKSGSRSRLSRRTRKTSNGNNKRSRASQDSLPARVTRSRSRAESESPDAEALLEEFSAREAN